MSAGTTGDVNKFALDVFDDQTLFIDYNRWRRQNTFQWIAYSCNYFFCNLFRHFPISLKEEYNNVFLCVIYVYVCWARWNVEQPAAAILLNIK